MKALIVAGEASGDIYGAQLATVLRERLPDLQVSGMGGDQMQEAGVSLLYHHRFIAVVGVFEVVAKLKRLRQAYKALTDWIDNNSPGFAILIDFPDFNFRLARFLKKRGIKTIYFISPQIWAWRKTRIHFLKKHVDLMITVLPFEKRLYDAEGIPTVYVGHPLVEIVRGELSAQPPYPRGEKPLIGIMPGSRDTEVRRHLSVLVETTRILREQVDLDVILIRAPSLPLDHYDIPSYIRVVNTDRYAAMNACDLMLIASGTSTLEAAILNVPFLIVYRVGGISWYLGKFLVRVPYYGLVNWIAQRKIIPEFMQNDMRADLLARETLSLLRDLKAREKLKTDLEEVVESLGTPGAMNRAADAIVSLF